MKSVPKISQYTMQVATLNPEAAVSLFPSLSLYLSSSLSLSLFSLCWMCVLVLLSLSSSSSVVLIVNFHGCTDFATNFCVDQGICRRNRQSALVCSNRRRCTYMCVADDEREREKWNECISCAPWCLTCVCRDESLCSICSATFHALQCAS